jgi:hypothetical protein
MSTGTIIGIIVLFVIVAVIAVLYDTHRRRLRRCFGPEYDRLVTAYGTRKAQAELTARQQRVRDLPVRPLDPVAQERYAREWAAAQEGFVDAPRQAVAGARQLVLAVMTERGYPTERDDQILADLSVGHADVLDGYRGASQISERAAEGAASTEELRQAMIGYRGLFQELLGETREAREPGASAAVRAPAGAQADGESQARARPAEESLSDTARADGQRKAGLAREAG